MDKVLNMSNLDLSQMEIYVNLTLNGGHFECKYGFHMI